MTKVTFKLTYSPFNISIGYLCLVKGELELFDSLAISSNTVQLLKIKFKRHISYNNIAFQKTDSSTCGSFCLYYITSRYYEDEVPFQEFLSSYFSRQKYRNERKVQNHLKHLKNGRF
jgi:hypothetical protein